MDLLPEIERNVAAALAEDVGDGDLTAPLTPADGARALSFCAAGRPCCAGSRGSTPACASSIPRRVDLAGRAKATDVPPDTRVCETAGQRAGACSTGERSALNFLQLLTAVATHPPLRRRRRRHARDNRGYPQDAAGAAARAEIRGSHRAAAQPSHRALRRHADQGKPHRRGGRNHAGARPRRETCPRAPGFRSRWRTSSSCARRSPPARR